MRLSRLRGMGLPELATRGRQHALKWLEPWLRSEEGPGFAADHALLREEFLAFGPGRFYEGAVDPDVPTLLGTQMPQARARILEAAEEALSERYDLLGYRGLDFGHPIDWHRDPVSGRCAPRVPWARLDPLASSAVGDSKVIWELSRHQWLVTLAQAYRLTGDERFAAEAARQASHWMAENPPGIGINWASSLEVALRLISWCWVLLLLRGSCALTPELLARLLAGVVGHASHVERYLSSYFSPNTHLTGEALGLFYAGTLLRDLPKARRWLEKGSSILVEQGRRQMLADGVHFEQATCYQRYTVEIGLHFLILAARNGVLLPREVGERVERQLDFLLHVRRPDGCMPAIGDADGGWLLPLAPRRSPDDLRGVFAVAAAVFGRPDFAWAANGVAPEVLWLLGPAGLRAFEALAPAPPASNPSRLFWHGGYAVMASGWEQDAHHLVFDAGPLGCPVSGAHGHADLLSVQCSAFGEAFVVDPGTYVYTAEPAWRDYFRSTAAHSALTVDGVGQAAPAGPFAWSSRPRARLRGWRCSSDVAVAGAEHDARDGLGNPLVHRRRVAFVDRSWWLVVDDLEGLGEHRVEVSFQLAPLPVGLEPGPWVRVTGRRGGGLLVRAFSTASATVHVHEGERNPIRGWVSSDYGQRRPAPQVAFSMIARFPLRVLTLLLPVSDAAAPAPQVSVLYDEEGMAAGLRFDETADRVELEGDSSVVLVRADSGCEDADMKRKGWTGTCAASPAF